MATATLPSITATATATVKNPARRVRVPNGTYIKGFNAYNGLTAHNHLTNMGKAVSSDYAFAKAVSSSTNKSGRGRAGALAIKCSAAAEIFRIAAIMNGITLVGVAIGFVLLRIEAFVEESE